MSILAPGLKDLYPSTQPLLALPTKGQGFNHSGITLRTKGPCSFPLQAPGFLWAALRFVLVSGERKEQFLILFTMREDADVLTCTWKDTLAREAACASRCGQGTADLRLPKGPHGHQRPNGVQLSPAASFHALRHLRVPLLRPC